MITPRIIPCLLLKGNGLVKGIQFKNHKYVGDPLNAVKIFNDKEVDELIFLDIAASEEKRTVSIELVEKLAEECYMPFAVGGGISALSEIQQILYAGAEKVCINTYAVSNPHFITEAAQLFGSQSIIVSVDVKKNWKGKYQIITFSGVRKHSIDLMEYISIIEKCGAGEILITSIDHEGLMEGYDLELVRQISCSVNIPVIANGGAGNLLHLNEALHIGKASAVAAGSLFVFHGKKRAVLINFPDLTQRNDIIIDNE